MGNEILSLMADIQIDKKTHKVGLNNYYSLKNKKSQIILGDSHRFQSNHISRLKKKDFGLTRKWPTYTIRRDGKVFQHFDPSYYSDFMGTIEIDKKSISIVFENMGALYFNYKNNTYTNWINEVCDDSFIFEKLWKNHRYWESYSEEQMISAINLCVMLCREYDIVQDSVGHNSFMDLNDPAINYNGILTKSNYNSDFNDLNPSFDFKKFLKGLNSFK